MPLSASTLKDTQTTTAVKGHPATNVPNLEEDKKSDMSFLSLGAYSKKSSEMNSDWLWLTNNVDYMLNYEIRNAKIKVKGLTKVNVWFGSIDVEWNREVFNGIADVFVEFNSQEISIDRPYESQISILNALKRGLLKIASQGVIDEAAISHCCDRIVAQNFVGEGGLTDWAKIVDGDISAKLSMKTYFAHTDIYLDLRKGRKKPREELLATTWMPPFLCTMFIKQFEFQSAREILAKLRSSTKALPVERFGYQEFDVTRSKLPITIERVPLEKFDGEDIYFWKLKVGIEDSLC